MAFAESAIFAAARVPREPFVYKIDIDGYDVEVTRRVLQLGYRPRFIYVEHAYNFPPGFWFAVRYSASQGWMHAFTPGPVRAFTGALLAEPGVEVEQPRSRLRLLRHCVARDAPPWRCSGDCTSKGSSSCW